MNALDYTVPPDPQGTQRLPERAMFQSTDKKPHQQAVDSRKRRWNHIRNKRHDYHAIKAKTQK